jgi:Protein of unknown function (DUF4089)
MSDPLDNAIDTLSEALRIPVRADWKAEVKTQLQVILRHGSLVTEFPLPDDIEPAPIYEA